MSDKYLVSSKTSSSKLLTISAEFSETHKLTETTFILHISHVK